MARSRNAKKICLAYSGGLDTSVILHWLKQQYSCEVVAYTADVGQEEELSGLPEKAAATGASECVVRDLREEFVRDFVFPAIRRQRDLRGDLPARHRPGATADREASGRSRPTDHGLRRRGPRRHRARAMTRSASS